VQTLLPGTEGIQLSLQALSFCYFSSDCAGEKKAQVELMNVWNADVNWIT